MNMIPIISQMAILFLTVGLGFIGAKTGCMNEDSNGLLSKIVLNLTMPCSILYSVFKSSRVLSNGQVVLLLIMAGFAALIMIILSKILTCLFQIPDIQKGICEFMILFSNSAFIGYPVIRIIFDENASFYAAVVNMVFTTLSYTYGVTLFVKKDENHPLDVKVFLTPMVISSVAACAFYMVNIQIPDFLKDFLGFVDQVTSPLSMVSIGCALAFTSGRYMTRMWRVYLAIVLRMMAAPIFIALIMRLFISNQLMIGIVAIIVAMPAAASTTMFAAKYHGDQALASACVFTSTLASVVTIPLVSAILFAFIL